MVQKLITSPRTWSISRAIKLAAAPRAGRRRCRRGFAGIAARRCSEGEREDECSSAFNVEAASLRWQAAQILRGLI